MIRYRAVANLTLVSILVACGSGLQQTQGNGGHSCVPTDSDLPSDATISGREGAYQLVLVADQGGVTGATARGDLQLRTHPEGEARSSYPDVTFPLFGWTDIVLAEVGARTSGSTTSQDPKAPGVLSLVTHDDRKTVEILLRLGATLNRVDIRTVEGKYTVFQVRQLTESGFSGTWRSGPSYPEISGYFCADSVS